MQSFSALRDFYDLLFINISLNNLLIYPGWLWIVSYAMTINEKQKIKSAFLYQCCNGTLGGY